MAQEQVLEHEILPRANPGQHGREEQREEFEHASASLIGSPSDVLPSHKASAVAAGVLA